MEGNQKTGCRFKQGPPGSFPSGSGARASPPSALLLFGAGPLSCVLGVPGSVPWPLPPEVGNHPLPVVTTKDVSRYYLASFCGGIQAPLEDYVSLHRFYLDFMRRNERQKDFTHHLTWTSSCCPRVAGM